MYTNLPGTITALAFKSEIEPILQEIDISNNEALICGDNNINLLKINEESHFSEMLLPQNNIAYLIKLYKWINTNRQHILQIVVLCRNNP